MAQPEASKTPYLLSTTLWREDKEIKIMTRQNQKVQHTV